MNLVNAEKEKELWAEKGYEMYSYDRAAMINRTKAEPEWVHFGSGNLFRAFHSVFCDRLLDEGVLDKGIILVGGRNSAVIDDYYRKFDNLHIAVTLRGSGSVRKRVVGSVAESLKIGDVDRLKEVFANPALKVVTFTITEKGYRIADGNPYFEAVTALLYHRYKSCSLPLTMSSQDNCSHNGDILKFVIDYYSDTYHDDGFKKYIEEKVSFPISMIDKITPRPDQRIAEMLRTDGVEDVSNLDINYYLNCFCNAEESEYLVIEDDFRNGTPKWPNVIFTDKQTVEKTEKMKVFTCLNPVHTALAVFGCLLGHHLICEEMKDEVLLKLAKHIGYDEGMPVVVDPGIINPKEFLDEVINVRFSNPYLPDTPQRIATDTSQKIPVRFGETLKSYLNHGKKLTRLIFIPLTFAGWLRYLVGLDDFGNKFCQSPDPLLNDLYTVMGKYKLGDTVREQNISVILKNERIFGVDLEQCGLSGKVTAYLNEMLTGAGAVRKTLEKYV